MTRHEHELPIETGHELPIETGSEPIGNKLHLKPPFKLLNYVGHTWTSCYSAWCHLGNISSPIMIKHDFRVHYWALPQKKESRVPQWSLEPASLMASAIMPKLVPIHIYHFSHCNLTIETHWNGNTLKYVLQMVGCFPKSRNVSLMSE